MLVTATAPEREISVRGMTTPALAWLVVGASVGLRSAIVARCVTKDPTEATLGRHGDRLRLQRGQAGACVLLRQLGLIGQEDGTLGAEAAARVSPAIDRAAG